MELQLDSGVPVERSTIGARINELPSCYTPSDRPEHGVWYRVIGTGNQVALSLCEVDEVESNLLGNK